jgi:hypothetical protein
VVATYFHSQGGWGRGLMHAWKAEFDVRAYLIRAALQPRGRANSLCKRLQILTCDWSKVGLKLTPTPLHLEVGSICCVRGFKSSLVIGQKVEISPSPFTPRGRAKLLCKRFQILTCD